MSQLLSLPSAARAACAVAVAVAAAVPAITRAGIIADEGSFLAALTAGSTTHDFDSLDHGTVISNELAGVDFEGTGVIYDEASFPSGGATHSPPKVLLNQSPPAPIMFVFDSPVDGVGFYNTSIADRERLTLFDAQGGTLFQGELPEGSVNFLGFVSSTPIAAGSIVGIPPQTLGTIFIDDFSFGSVIPEPSGFLLFTGGIAALASRKQRVIARAGGRLRRRDCPGVTLAHLVAGQHLSRECLAPSVAPAAR